MQACSKCKLVKPLHEYAKCNGRKNGHRAACKLCVSTLYYQKKPLTVHSDPKICSVCNIAKPLTKFRKTWRKKDGTFSYPKECISCSSNYDRERKRLKLNKPKKHNINLPYEIDGEFFKVCSKCNVGKKITEFQKNNKVSFGVQSVCKVCSGKVYYTRHPKPRIAFQDPQTCKDCKVIKPLSTFPKRKHRDGTIGYNLKCSACASRPYAKKNYYNRKERLAANPELKKINNKKLVEAQLRRYARKKGASIVIKFTKAEIIKRDGLICYLCEKKLTEEKAVMEHLIPLSRGGNHKPENIKIACSHCNSKKYNKTVTEYKKWRGDYTKFQLRRTNSPQQSLAYP